MNAITRTLLAVLFAVLFVGLLIAQGLGAGAGTGANTVELAAGIFRELGVRVVRCPAYTFGGGNVPVCGVTPMTPEAYTEAFDKAAKGRLEPQGDWDEDHTVWLRRYTAEGATYAAVYSEIAQGFNVQLIRLR